MFKLIPKLLYMILACFVGLFVMSSLFVRAEYNYAAYGDNPILQGQRLWIYIPLGMLLFVAGVLLYQTAQRLSRYRPQMVIPGILLGAVIMQVALIILFPRLPTDDSQTVVALALSMLYDHDYSTFDPGGYLHMFPFNFSMVVYIKTLLSWFPDNYLVLKSFNILFSLVTTLMIYLIYRELYGKAGERDYGILLLAACYLPSLLMNNLIYNDVIATACLTSGMYALIRYLKQPSWTAILFSSVLIALGNYFRGIGVIFLIAAILTIGMKLRTLGWRKGLVATVLLAGLFNIPGWMQNSALQATGVVDEPVGSNAAPVSMWLHMGINLERFGFWDNMQSYNIYQREAGYDKAVSAALFKEGIAEKLTAASPGELMSMYFKKIVWTWTEGTYQIDRYGIGNDNNGWNRGRVSIMGGYSYSTFATKWFAGNSWPRTMLLWCLYAMNMLMYGFILVRLIGSIRSKRYEEVSLVLVLLGFIGFYILWEIKSRYLYPVYPLLMVMSYMGFKDVYRLFRARVLDHGRLFLGKGGVR